VSPSLQEPCRSFCGPGRPERSSAGRSRQSQSQQCTTINEEEPTTISSVGFGTGTLARTGAEDLLPLALGGVALGGAVVVRRGLRRRTAA